MNNGPMMLSGEIVAAKMLPALSTDYDLLRRMWFASPLWLIGLFPWAALSLWLLWGTYERASVPFLELWRGAAEERPTRRGFRRPPVSLWFVIAAMLLAILAAARLSVWRPTRDTIPLQVVIDCGDTMSASVHGAVRFRATARLLAEALSSHSRQIPVHLRIVPGNREMSTNSGGLDKAVDALTPTGTSSRGSLGMAVALSLRSGDDAVFVISDQPIELADPRIVRIAPEEAIDEVGISRLAARESPSPQVMVSVLNQSSQTGASLQVATAGQVERKTIGLPPRGTSRDFFFSPPELGENVEAAVKGLAGDVAGGRAWLGRDARAGVVESHIPLDPAIERMLQVYARHRPPAAGSPTITITGSETNLAAGSRGVVVAQSVDDAGAKAGALEIVDHPVTRGINWGSLPLFPATGDAPPQFQPLVRVGGKTILAVAQAPVRKAWIGFAIDRWSAQTQFVIFWTNVLDWIGQEGTQFTSFPLEEPMLDWQPMTGPAGFPGIYQRGDGALRAFNTFDSPLSRLPASTSDWRERLGALAARRAGHSVGGSMAVLALFCLLLAFSTWRQRPKTLTGAALATK
jgi:hypothetical protein